MPFKSYRDKSRTSYGADGDSVTLDELEIGCLQRIADATEVMAQNHQALINDRDLYKRWYEEERKTTLRLCHEIAGLRGYIKRIKKRSQ